MNYYMIRTDDMLNGDGLRVVLFVSGCQHRCVGCHNPETWSENGGKVFNEEAINSILLELENDYISGITISGGDPLYVKNVDEVYKLISIIRNNCFGKTIWLYTGYTWSQIFKTVVTDIVDPERDELIRKRREIVSMCDILVDGEFIEQLADVNCPWVGSTNQSVIDVQASLKSNNIIKYNN